MFPTMRYPFGYKNPPWTQPQNPQPAENPAVNLPESTKGDNYPVYGRELARAYVPWQMYGVTYSPAEALEKGTLFPDLYRPYPY